MPNTLSLWIVTAALLSVCCATSAAGGAVLEIRPGSPIALQSDGPAKVALLVSNCGDADFAGQVSFTCKGGTADPPAAPLSLRSGEWAFVSTQVSLAEEAAEGELACKAGVATLRLPVLRGIDLGTLPWKRVFTARDGGMDPRYASPEVDDRNWTEMRLPALWTQTDYAWCRTRVVIPECWKGRKVRLIMGAVDDNDITYLNGEEIGRTNGWNVRREYAVPDKLIRWGQDNLLTVMADNFNAGGGPYKPPFLLVVGDVPVNWQATPADGLKPRPGAGKIGAPLPLRQMRVEAGVLRYPEGTEVALWGVNYYPQSWHQFDNMTKLKLDMKKTIREDLDHLQMMRVEAIRIHVFDREISDGRGNLVPNVHLDLLDYLVSECSRRGIYMYFTPIAWWAGPNERKGAFSAETSKPGMMLVPTAKAAAANYLKQFLTHKNRYSGRAYKDEPCLCLLEVMNEPMYFGYGDLRGSSYPGQGERQEVLARDRQTLRDLWAKWLAENNLDDQPANYALFRYEMIRLYIREMVGAIRSTGAKQPVAISFFGVTDDDIIQAIADSECDAITVSAYPGGWDRVNDGINLLPRAAPLSLDNRLSGKARLAYEFDTPATNVSCYLFPALAAHFRAGEVQVACQFQYDSASTARWNTDWNAHWLNWLYTPSKVVSFMIGGEAFRRLPRGAQYAPPKTELILGPIACSFDRNLSLLALPDTFMNSRSVGDWRPLAFPKAPRRIVGTGSSPYVDYAGTGLYMLEEADDGLFRLKLNPDSRLVGNCLHGSFAAPVAELEENVHFFGLKLPGWEKATCRRIGGGSKSPVPATNGGWLLRPGLYEICRSTKRP